MGEALFAWDPPENQAGNTFHVLAHMEPAGFEYLVLEGEPVLIASQVVDGEARHRAVAYDPHGQAWTFVYTLREGLLRPITLWPTTKASELRKLAAGRPPISHP